MPPKGSRKYDDDIEKLPVSRQRKRQLRYERMGLCGCGRPLARTSLAKCIKHLTAARLYSRAKGRHKPRERYKHEAE